MTNPTTQTQKAFDIHTKCAGYINRIREVSPTKGRPYFAATICAMRGLADSNGKFEYTYFDCSVVGKLAIKRVQELLSFQKEEKKIFVTCKIGDIYPDMFTLTKGNNAGKTCVSIKGRLLRIDTAKVNGENYEFEAQPEESNNQNIPVNQQANQDCNSQPDSVTADQNIDQQQSDQDADANSELPPVLKLNPEDSDYPEQILEVTGWGYKRDPQDGLWKLPEAA